MKILALVLAIAAIQAANCFNPITPYNYCADKDFDCLVCSANKKGFMDHSCDWCAKGRSKDIPQIPGTRRCVSLPEADQMCLIPEM